MQPHLVTATQVDGVPSPPKTYRAALGNILVAGTWPGCPDTSEMLSWRPQVLTRKVGASLLCLHVWERVRGLSPCEAGAMKTAVTKL